MTNRLSIIDALESARNAQGMTQGDLADRAGTSRMTVVRVEAGHDTKLATVHEMARALGLELMLVPKALAGEVQAFIQSGGRVLGQPSGAGAPDSVVQKALAISHSVHTASKGIRNLPPTGISAENLKRHMDLGLRGGRIPMPAGSAGVLPSPAVPVPSHRVSPVTGGVMGPPAKPSSKGPAISPAALERLHGSGMAGPKDSKR